MKNISIYNYTILLIYFSLFQLSKRTFCLIVLLFYIIQILSFSSILKQLFPLHLVFVPVLIVPLLRFICVITKKLLKSNAIQLWLYSIHYSSCCVGYDDQKINYCIECFVSLLFLHLLYS